MKTTSTQTLRKRLLTKNGQFCTIVYKKPLKTNAANSNITVESVTTCQARAGVEYDKIQQVAENRESGAAPKTNKGLPYGEWIVYPFILTHKGTEYWRFATADTNVPVKKEYFINGKPAKLEEVKKVCIPSQFKAKQSVAIFNLPAENILDLK